jgi:TrmH family RNA methyltransferase
VRTPLGAHNPRLAAVRALLTSKGRREQSAFSFEGATLLQEAIDSAMPLHEVFASGEMLQSTAIAAARAAGIPVSAVDERGMRRISDLETPAGVLAVAAVRYTPLADVFARPGFVAVLAGLNDPGNAGTLLRSAEAFGIDRVVFGTPGVDPYHPKVVRGAMGALFRMEIAAGTPGDIRSAAEEWTAVGLAAAGEPIAAMEWPARSMIVVGHERHGLGPFGAICGRLAAIPMRGRTESLNAAVAGSIAFYEATKRKDS